MVSFNETHLQLMHSKSQLRFVGVSEVRQLSRILQSSEEIMSCVKGWHQGNLSLMCATSERILILPMNQQKPTIIQVFYDQIISLKTTEKALHKQVILSLANETIVFSSWRKKYVKDMYNLAKRHTAYKKELIQDNEDVYKIPLRLRELSQHIRYAQQGPAKDF